MSTFKELFESNQDLSRVTDVIKKTKNREDYDIMINKLSTLYYTI